MWHTVIATATDWSNFFALRTAAGAQPEIRQVALLMKDTFESSPTETAGWHLPLVQLDEEEAAAADPKRWALISAARCARVSYLTHNGTRRVDLDEGLAERLLTDGHMSPFEHVARAMSVLEFEQLEKVGKLRGWIPYRSPIPNEDDFSKVAL